MFRAMLRIFYNKLYFSLLQSGRSIHIGEKVQFSRSVRFRLIKGSVLNVGSHVVSDGAGYIYADKAAVIEIGSRVYFNDGINISCKKHIQIDDGCLFGPDVKIYDNNHKFSRKSGVSFEHSTGEITIGKKCWIGANAVILKNTHIGDRCVIGAGCIVSGDIPDGMIVSQKRELQIKPIEDR